MTHTSDTSTDAYNSSELYAAFAQAALTERGLLREGLDDFIFNDLIHVAYYGLVKEAEVSFDKKDRIALRDHIALIASIEEEHTPASNVCYTPFKRPPSVDIMFAFAVKWSEDRNANIQGRESLL
jgi:hypothetical protein